MGSDVDDHLGKRARSRQSPRLHIARARVNNSACADCLFQDLYADDGPGVALGEVPGFARNAASLNAVVFQSCRAENSGIVHVGSENARLENCAFRDGQGSHAVSRNDVSAFVYSDPPVQARPRPVPLCKLSLIHAVCVLEVVRFRSYRPQPLCFTCLQLLLSCSHASGQPPACRLRKRKIYQLIRGPERRFPGSETPRDEHHSLW